MDRFKQLSTFVSAAMAGSFSAAAREEGVAPAMVGRRIDALESRLGVKLLSRSTRSLSLTAEGMAFLQDAKRILQDLDETEIRTSQASRRASGHLRVTAPAGFGRQHVAPLLPAYQQAYPEVTVTLDLSDRLADLIEERFDCAIRLGELTDSGLTGVRLAENRRVVVAAPAYLAEHGTPQAPAALAGHQCLSFGSAANQARGWLFQIDGQVVAQRVTGRLSCNDGSVLHAWTLAGCGLAWRSLWEVHADLSAGRLVRVLDDYAAPSDGIYALVSGRKRMPPRVRAFIEHLRSAFSQYGHWGGVDTINLPSSGPTMASPVDAAQSDG
jgi:DNA-binding transcriptional LysR family regulator